MQDAQIDQLVTTGVGVTAKAGMTDEQMYVRLLTELHPRYAGRETLSTRRELSDVLVELRSRAAAARKDSCGFYTQASCEHVADDAVLAQLSIVPEE